MGYAHRAAVTFSGDTPSSPRAGIALEDLLACPFSGKFFAPWEARIRAEPRANPPSAARTFFCPVCPSAALRIHALGAREAASCTLCGWVTSRASLHEATDLLARETDPWPKVSAAVNARSAPARHRVPAPAHRSPPRKRTVAQCAADERDQEARLRGLQVHRDGDRRMEEEVTDAQRRKGSVRVAKILPLSATVLAKDVWLRESLPPRRRLREPKITLESPYACRTVRGAVIRTGVGGEEVMRKNAARFMPAVVSARVVHDCFSEDDGSQRVQLNIVFRNVRTMGVHVAITDENAVQQVKDAKSASIGAGEEVELEMMLAALHVPYGPTETCPAVMHLRMEVQFDFADQGVERDEEDTDDGAKPFWEHKWECIMFVTHERSALRKSKDLLKSC